MSFQFACFISYRHSDKEKTVQFIEQFVDALENSLDQRLQQGVYIDCERLKAGYKFNIAIAGALRQSVCMIAILSPRYYGSDYCRREYAAMERIEARRRADLGIPPAEKGLVIPLLVWGGEDEVPQATGDNLHYVSMPLGLTNLRSEIKYDSNLVPINEKIGDLICEHHKSFADGNPCVSRLLQPGMANSLASRTGRAFPLPPAPAPAPAPLPREAEESTSSRASSAVKPSLAVFENP